LLRNRNKGIIFDLSLKQTTIMTTRTNNKMIAIGKAVVSISGANGYSWQVATLYKGDKVKFNKNFHSKEAAITYAEKSNLPIFFTIK
jgi:hypothetical protein